MARTATIKAQWEDRGARFTEVDGVEILADFGDPRREYAAVVQGGLAAIERGERETMAIFGEEAIPWLQGLVTNDLHDLVDEGSGHRNAMVNTTGRFVAEARMLHLPQLLVLDMEPKTLHEAGLFNHLKQHIILEDVTLADRSDATWRMGIYGERGPALLADFADWSHDLSTRPAFDGAWTRWEGIDVIAQRVVWADVPAIELSCAVEDGPQLLSGLEEAAGELPLFGHQAFEILRIESGVPRFGVELHDKVIPLEAGFDDAISFNKGCYLGQEIIARLDTLGTPAKLLRRLIVDGDEVPDVGSDIYPDGGGKRAIGSVESATYSPKFEAPVAMAYIKRGHNEIGGHVQLGDSGPRAQLDDILKIQ